MIPGSTKLERRERKKTAEGIYIPEEVDKLAWYRFAALADQLGFTSMAIASLKPMDEATTEVPSNQAKPSFVTAGSGESEERRSGRPYDRAYKQSQSSLFLNNVHSTDQSQGCGITPFFARRSIYLAFLGSVTRTPCIGTKRWPRPRPRSQSRRNQKWPLRCRTRRSGPPPRSLFPSFSFSSRTVDDLHLDPRFSNGNILLHNMSPKDTASEELWKKAAAKGYRHSVHRAEDCQRKKKPYRSKTRYDQDCALRYYEKCV